MNYVRTSIPASEYQAVKPSKQRSGKQYYYVRANAKEEDGIVSAVEVEIDHEPTAAEIEQIAADYLAHLKKCVLISIEGYDRSDEVNGFKINGEHGWADKATRVGLHNSISIEKEAGAQTTVIYVNGKAYTLPVDQALQMLAALELYAIDCYRKTEEHKAAVEAMTDPDEVQKYDYAAGYPQQLEFEIP